MSWLQKSGFTPGTSIPGSDAQRDTGRKHTDRQAGRQTVEMGNGGVY